MPIAYQFLPWARRGLAVALDTEDNLGVGAPMAARGSASVGVTLAAPHEGTAIAPTPMRLFGPGDVIGIDQRLVVRTDPKPNTRDFEPNYLPIVDFDPPDFAWMLTPAKAQGDTRLRPWLVLIVLEVAKTGLPVMSASAALPSIRIKAADVDAELPNLGESWSWAHTQLVNENAAQIQTDLQTKPASNISRLISPRRLREKTDYVACVVPAFKPGVLRGLGLVVDENDPTMTTLAPAWNKAVAADVVLPVYYHWEFSTSAKGDFESLARLLRTPGSYKGTALEAQLAAVGTIPMSVDNLLSATPGRITTMEGALVPISYNPGELPHPDHSASLQVIVNTPQDQVANPVGNGATNAENRRIEVKPPLVGAWHAKRHQVRIGTQPAGAPRLGNHWLADLNLNPRYRGAAGYGAEVVRKFQEDYVDACWDQIGDILEAERKFNLTRLAIEALGLLKKKHFDALPSERVLQLFGPALPRIEALGTAAQTYRIGGKIASLGGRLDRSSMPAALMDTAMRRVTSPANRALRLGARLSGQLNALPAVTSTYLNSMAQASKKSAAFAVNNFTPDGVVGTTMFEGVRLGADANAPIDLSGIGLSGKFTVGQVKQAIDGAKLAKDTLTSKGVPELKVRDAQRLGVFTDMHADRFGTLLSSSPTVKSSDWGKLGAQLELQGRRGVEGFLVESTVASGLLQVSAMRLDARNGQFQVDRVTAQFDAARRALPLQAARATPRTRAIAARAGLKVGTVSVDSARDFKAGGLVTALPPNSLVSTPGAAAPDLRLNESLEFEGRRPASEIPPVVSVTFPPTIREREVLNRFTTATRGVQTTWRDAFADKRVEVQVVDFPLAQAAAVVRARADPALTLPLRLASSVSIAATALGQTMPHVAAYLGSGKFLDLRFMIPVLADRVMAWSHLRNVFYEDLAKYDKNAFMPGVDDLPNNLIMLVQVNQYFIDAVMAGANFEMNRELLWRGFPTDLRGTPFQRFWGRVNGFTGELLDDMEPMHLWNAQPLGKRTDPNMTDPNRIALLVRGQLLRRYPNTAVYAWKKRTTPPADAEDVTKLMKDANGNPSPNAIQWPVFSGVIPPDITFFGFDIDREDVDDWCFVLEEQMSEPRFGFDVELVPAGQPQGIKPKQRAALKSTLERLAVPGNALLASGYNAYKALSWSHIGVAAGGFTSVATLADPPNKPFDTLPTLPPNPTAADIAKVLLQEPFRAYYLGSDLKT